MQRCSETRRSTCTWRTSRPRSGSIGIYLLGFTETFRTPSEGAPIHVELRLGGLVLGVATFDSAQHLHSLDVGRPQGTPRGEVVVWTDDVDRAFASLTGRGARPLSEPHDFLGRLRAAWIADPDGNPVQLVMRLDGSGGRGQG